MLHESFLLHRSLRYLWLAMALSAFSLVWYLLDRPPGEPPNGGTIVGYGLGTLGALLIVWLGWFGIRKRSYHSRLGTVRGWLSAHVYLGLALVVIATLHSGFQFGMNVHTGAYLLLLLVVASGIFGVVIYVRFPRQMSDNRNESSQDQLLQTLGTLDEDCVAAAATGSEELKAVINSMINGTGVGGGFWAQLRGRDVSSVTLPKVLDQEWHGEQVLPNPGQEAVLEWLAHRRAGARDRAANERLTRLMQLIANRRNILATLRRDIQIRALLDIWLYVHVPATVALLVTLTIHIVIVFMYW